LKNSPAYRIRYIVCQKGVENLVILSQFITLFGTGIVTGHSQKENYCYIVSSLNNIAKIFPYFDANLENFIGIKKTSYIKFKEMHKSLIEKKHLDISLRTSLVSLCKDINISRKHK